MSTLYASDCCYCRGVVTCLSQILITDPIWAGLQVDWLNVAELRAAYAAKAQALHAVEVS